MRRAALPRRHRGPPHSSHVGASALGQAHPQRAPCQHHPQPPVIPAQRPGPDQQPGQGCGRRPTSCCRYARHYCCHPCCVQRGEVPTASSWRCRKGRGWHCGDGSRCGRGTGSNGSFRNNSTTRADACGEHRSDCHQHSASHAQVAASSNTSGGPQSARHCRGAGMSARWDPLGGRIRA